MPGAVLLLSEMQYYFYRKCSTTSIGNAVLLHPPMQYYFCGERNCKTGRTPHAGAQARAGSEGMRSCALCGQKSSPDAGESPLEPRIIQKCLPESPLGPVLQIVWPRRLPCLGEGGRLSWADSPCNSCNTPWTLSLPWQFPWTCCQVHGRKEREEAFAARFDFNTIRMPEFVERAKLNASFLCPCELFGLIL